MTTSAIIPAPTPRRIALLGLLVALTAGCGGGGSGPGPVALQPVPTDGVARFASGPILTACTQQRRTAATRARCGCVQSAANLTLSPEEQRRGAAYFEDPELLQARKLSDTPANERFWEQWARFAETAEDLCRAI